MISGTLARVMCPRVIWDLTGAGTHHLSLRSSDTILESLRSASFQLENLDCPPSKFTYTRKVHTAQQCCRFYDTSRYQAPGQAEIQELYSFIYSEIMIHCCWRCQIRRCETAANKISTVCNFSTGLPTGIYINLYYLFILYIYVIV